MTIFLNVSDFAGREELLSHMARELDFADHFGCNFSALADCLGEINEPTTFVVVGYDPDMSEWKHRLLHVLADRCVENPSLKLMLLGDR